MSGVLLNVPTSVKYCTLHGVSSYGYLLVTHWCIMGSQCAMATLISKVLVQMLEDLTGVGCIWSDSQTAIERQFVFRFTSCLLIKRISTVCIQLRI